MSEAPLSKKEAAYLAKMRADAESFQLTSASSDAAVEEIRRWEGNAAATNARLERQRNPRHGYTQISETPSRPGAAARRAPSGRTNTFAILSIVFSLFGSLLGVIFGHVALSQIERTGDEGRGLAIAGLAIGYAGLVLLAILGAAAAFA